MRNPLKRPNWSRLWRYFKRVEAVLKAAATLISIGSICFNIWEQVAPWLTHFS